jgi:hypothetical protein
MCFHNAITFSVHSHPVFMREMQNAKKFMVFILRLLSLAFKRNPSEQSDCSKGILRHNNCKISRNLKLNVRLVFNLVPRTKF